MESRNSLVAVGPATLLVVALLVIPSAVLLEQSLRHYDPAAQTIGGFTLENYIRVLSDRLYLDVLFNTLRLSAIVTLACLFLGYPIAYFIAHSRSRFAPLVAGLVLIPLFVSVVIRSFGWMVLLAKSGPLNEILLSMRVIGQPLQLLYTDVAVIVGLVHILAPFMILPIASVLRGIDPALEEAARNLGASDIAVLRRVIIPLSAPGIMAGVVLVYAHSIAAFVLPAMLGSIRMRLVATTLYQQILTVGDVPLGSALAIVLIAMTLALFWLVYRFFGIKPW